MFETIDDELKKQADTKHALIKSGIFVVAMGVLGLVIYFFAFTGMNK